MYYVAYVHSAAVQIKFSKKKHEASLSTAVVDQRSHAIGIPDRRRQRGYPKHLSDDGGVTFGDGPGHRDGQAQTMRCRCMEAKATAFLFLLFLDVWIFRSHVEKYAAAKKTYHSTLECPGRSEKSALNTRVSLVFRRLAAKNRAHFTFCTIPFLVGISTRSLSQRSSYFCGPRLCTERQL